MSTTDRNNTGVAVPQRPARIGYIGAGTTPQSCPVVGAFRQGLREYDLVEGRDVEVEYRLAALQAERYPALVDELVGLGVDLLVVADSLAIPIAKAATRAIPIVMSVVSDPVAEGLVESLERPGGNLTGMSNLARALTGRRLELLRAVVPRLSRVGVLWNDEHPGVQCTWQETTEAATALGLELVSLAVRGADAFRQAFAAAGREGVQALLVLTDRLTTFHRQRIAALALAYRLPGMYG
jgi:putative ABC transport system substrate-binding protein